MVHQQSADERAKLGLSVWALSHNFVTLLNNKVRLGKKYSVDVAREYGEGAFRSVRRPTVYDIKVHA